MSLVKIAKKKLRPLKQNESIQYLYNKYRIKKQKSDIKRYTDSESIKISYKHKTGRDVNIKNPERFTEKLQWLKMYYRNANMKTCADKYDVRNYIEKKGYDYTLNNVYGIWDKVEEIDFDSLPEKFVLKATHGCGMNLFCKNKAEINWKSWKRIMSTWLDMDIYIDGREWVYQDLKKRIICEEYLEDENSSSSGLTDYKFLCFDGEVYCIFVDIDRYTSHKRNYYDSNWNFMEINSDDPNAGDTIPKPEQLEEMKSIAKDLAKDFPVTRVDLYIVNDKIYFGEMTFFPWCGYVQFYPDEFDFKLGKQLKLPRANYNLDKLI